MLATSVHRSGAPVAALAALGALTLLLVLAVVPAHAATVGPLNPVRVPLNGHPANSGFLVFVEGNVALNADEAEGTIAAGGNLSFSTSYNVQAGGSPAVPTFTAPGDAGPTYLYVGGGVTWAGTSVLKVLNSGYTKIANTSTYSAYDRDMNNAVVNYNITLPNAGYGASPRIEGSGNTQTAASIGTPVPSSLIDVPNAFTLYRTLSAQYGACTSTVGLVNPDTNQPLVPPYAQGARGRLTLAPNVTNVLNIASADLGRLAEITFTNSPTATAPLLVNVTGTTLTGSTPNLAGIGGGAAPYILWNFPEATSITVTGGDSIEGTLYAPNADLNWIPTTNIEGNIIAKSFIHGAPGPVPIGSVREVHDFPFAAELSCENNLTPTGSPTPTPTDTDTATPTPTPTTTTARPSPSPSEPTPTAPNPSASNDDAGGADIGSAGEGDGAGPLALSGADLARAAGLGVVLVALGVALVLAGSRRPILGIRPRHR